jgi:hypothetical protein
MVEGWPLDLFHLGPCRRRATAWKIPSDGGQVQKVTDDQALAAVESPDGLYVYYAKSNVFGGPPGVWRKPADGGPEEKIVDHTRVGMWSLLEDGIYYIDYRTAPGASIEFFDFSTGQTRWIELLDK